ncbi:MAG: LysM peptidoglycan-binding domain-containing protein, partial [Anaerolineae bacterium]|nr:LysM peptidoglycan-binding domain-containing protein [Anaerolineae bacterium]
LSMIQHHRYRHFAARRIRQIASTVWLITSMALPLLGLASAAGVDLRPVDTDTIIHTVAAGETLSRIASRYGVTIEAIMQANGLANPDRIVVGQVLSIPRELEGGGQLHVIRSGETLSLIAARYGVSIEAIMQANGLASADRIVAGQQLTIPSGTHISQAEPEAAATAPETTYVVQRGDSLYRISLMFGVSTDDLLASNSLANPSALYTGLPLRIPAAPVTYTESTAPAEPAEAEGGRGGGTYVVRAGDTLASIAIENDVTVDGIIVANGLTSAGRIFAGQELRLPEPGSAARPFPGQGDTAHTIAPGETLAAIALNYGVTVQALLAANNLRSAAEAGAGMTIAIPGGLVGTNSVRYASDGSGLCENVTVSHVGSGYFILPVYGYVFTQKFHEYHPGVDLATDLGVPVYAADGGTVMYAGWNPYGYGNLVVLDHGNGWRTYYGHLSRYSVGCGDWAPRGSIIAEVGSTGNSSGPHLHFEMLRFGVAVNPAGSLQF